MRTDDVIYVAPDELHQFRNVGDEPLVFLCLVPNKHDTITIVDEA